MAYSDRRRTVYNLAGDEQWTFDEHTLPEYALAYCQLVLEAGPGDELWKQFWEIAQVGRLPELYEVLPFEYGRRSVGLGDLATPSLKTNLF